MQLQNVWTWRLKSPQIMRSRSNNEKSFPCWNEAVWPDGGSSRLYNNTRNLLNLQHKGNQSSFHIAFLLSPHSSIFKKHSYFYEVVQMKFFVVLHQNSYILNFYSFIYLFIIKINNNNNNNHDNNHNLCLWWTVTSSGDHFSSNAFASWLHRFEYANYVAASRSDAWYPSARVVRGAWFRLSGRG